MTPQSRRLSRVYRRQQRLITRAVATQLTALWPSLVNGDFDTTFEPWLRQATAITSAGHSRSAAAAATFYRLFRRLEVGGEVTPVVPQFDPARTRNILSGASVGVLARNARQGIPFAESVRSAEYWTTGAATRQALAGGRDLIRETVVEDPRALGWARAASGDACGFCAMLASRGPVYSESTVDFESHDNCSCYPVPVYSRNQGWPDNSERFRDMRDETESPEDFRSLVESGT